MQYWALIAVTVLDRRTILLSFLCFNCKPAHAFTAVSPNRLTNEQLSAVKSAAAATTLELTFTALVYAYRAYYGTW
jgi:hypothetical protein